jgi:hypothetical protein
MSVPTAITAIAGRFARPAALLPYGRHIDGSQDR